MRSRRGRPRQPLPRVAGLAGRTRLAEGNESAEWPADRAQRDAAMGWAPNPNDL